MTCPCVSVRARTESEFLRFFRSEHVWARKHCNCTKSNLTNRPNRSNQTRRWTKWMKVWIRSGKTLNINSIHIHRVFYQIRANCPVMIDWSLESSSLSFGRECFFQLTSLIVNCLVSVCVCSCGNFLCWKEFENNKSICDLYRCCSTAYVDVHTDSYIFQLHTA